MYVILCMYMLYLWTIYYGFLMIKQKAHLDNPECLYLGVHKLYSLQQLFTELFLVEWTFYVTSHACRKLLFGPKGPK